jgi:osmotically inducible lipoprotein OsmB
MGPITKLVAVAALATPLMAGGATQESRILTGAAVGAAGGAVAGNVVAGTGGAIVGGLLGAGVGATVADSPQFQ